MGSFGVTNGGDPELLLGMSRDTVALILGRPADSSVGLMIYRFRDITVTVKYVNNAAAQIEIDCDRWVSFDGGNFLVAYNNTKSDMVARYGQPDRDENLTWWYDARGIGFIYDYFSNPLRIKKAVVYYPNGSAGRTGVLHRFALPRQYRGQRRGRLPEFVRSLCQGRDA